MGSGCHFSHLGRREGPGSETLSEATTQAEIQDSTAYLVLTAGDVAQCDSPGDEQTAALMDTLAGTVFALGDLVYPNGTAGDFQRCYEPTWGRFRDRIRAAPGNHEYRSAGARPYYDYFGAAAGPPGLGYYSFEAGDWHVVSLNSNIPMTPRSAQGQWLQEDLRSHPAQCTLAFFHHPRFSSGPHGNSANVTPLWRMLHEAGADVVLQGHDHVYERFDPLDPDGRPDPARGIRSFVVGTGGASTYGFMRQTPGSAYRYNRGFGVLQMRLYDDHYTWAYRTVTGQVLDRGEATCR